MSAAQCGEYAVAQCQHRVFNRFAHGGAEQNDSRDADEQAEQRGPGKQPADETMP